MKGWRGRAADIFAKHGKIAAKMKSAPGPGTSDSYVVQSRRTGIVIGAGGAADIFAKHGEIAAKMKSAPGPGTTDLGYSTTPHPTKGVRPRARFAG